MTYPQVHRYWAQILGIGEEELPPESPLRADMTSIARLVIQCEQAFRITIQDEDVLDFKTVSELAAYIDERLADGQDDYALPTDQARTAWYYE